MVNRTAAALVLRDGDKEKLERWVRSTSMPANQDIAAQVGVSRPTVNRWRNRYLAEGMVGLADVKRPGRPRTVDHAKIIAATLKPPPKSLGVTHWSSRLLAPRLGLHPSTVADAWKDYGVKPWKADTFKFSTDPELVAKVTDVIGLYMSPPQDAIVLSVDELCEASHNLSDVKSSVM